ncbi:polynucleotide adenylyltransferase PcnB [Endozoicomonas sp. SESOKO1]|uniref:polynucleotide adenylyltransferase PcnB n=1 Tax=Endozoicomonas sp. SESOKO1 TaxID=2828742 RepID=UPI0021475B6B|nr:polynucleotide adenylyltransferase PcnB [Endozoicomonas sp. SESOKO1]
MYSYTTAIAVLVLGGTLIFWLMRNRNQSKRHRPSVNIKRDPQKTIIPRDKHPVSRRYINDNALKVINRLNGQGYEAYLVGGCIRDLYLDLHPKDFDVATNASPEEVRRLFRNSRLIGRRFKLVHVLFGREMIEVATFRASHEQQHHGREKSRHSESGRILRDNVYGSMEDDAMRRDFTVNALYYDGRDFSVVDFCNGVDDIRTGTLRLIGDPVTRYHEDPVRMLRAIRFAAKLNFTMAPETEQPIRELGHLLRDIPAARMFDEVLKLLQSGQGVRTFELLREYQLFGPLFPATEHCLQEQQEMDNHAFSLIIESLKSTDRRVRQGRPVTPAFLFAALLWAPMRRMARAFMDQGMPPVPAFQQASMTVITNQCNHTAIPRRFSMMVRDIWDLQIRLERRQPRLIEGLLEHPKFRAAYDFLVLREQSGENLASAGQWWTEIQELDEHGRHAMIKSLTSHGGQKKQGNTRRRRRRKPRNGDASSAHRSGES